MSKVNQTDNGVVETEGDEADPDLSALDKLMSARDPNLKDSGLRDTEAKPLNKEQQ